METLSSLGGSTKQSVGLDELQGLPDVAAALLAAAATPVHKALALTGATVQKSGVELLSLLVLLVDEVLLLLLCRFWTVFHLSQWRILHCSHEQ